MTKFIFNGFLKCFSNLVTRVNAQNQRKYTKDKRKHQAVDQNDFGKQNIFWATKVMWPRKAGKQKQGTQLTKSIIDFTRAGLQGHLFTKPDKLDLDLDTMY